MCCCSLDGLSDPYAVAALHARAFTFVGLVEPARFLLSKATRPEVRRVFNAIDRAIDALPTLTSYGVLKSAILTEFPEWEVGRTGVLGGGDLLSPPRGDAARPGPLAR